MMGGFLQLLGRHLRSSVRPLFLPAGSLLAPSRDSSVPPSPASVKKGVAAATRSAIKEKSAAPVTPSPPTALKKSYDAVSVVSVQLTLAYIVIPFLLIDVKASIASYHRLYWYGHVATFLPLLFFWLGGGAFLKGLLRERGEKEAEVERYEQKVNDKLGVDSVKGINSVAPQLAVDGQAE